MNPELHAGEAYMDGTLTFEEGSDVGGFMLLFSVNRGGLAADPGDIATRADRRRRADPPILGAGDRQCQRFGCTSAGQPDRNRAAHLGH